MADIINFASAKKDNTRDKVKFLADMLVTEHKSVMKHIYDMLIFDTTILKDKSTGATYNITIATKGVNSCKIEASKNKMSYSVSIIDYENDFLGTETNYTFKKELSGEYEITKKRKKVNIRTGVAETKYTKAAFDMRGALEARITYIRDSKNTLLLQENTIPKDKRLVNVYIYDDRLNLESMLKGLKKENGYVFYEGFTGGLRVPEEKAVFALGIKDLLMHKTKFVVRGARTEGLEVITRDEMNVLNNKEKIEKAISQISHFDGKRELALEQFEGLKKYINEFDEEVIIIRLNDGHVFKNTKKNSTIFDVQAEKYKCFYENDFLNPNNIVSEVETLTYPLVPINETIITKVDAEENRVIRKTFEEYDDEYLLLKRIKDEKDGRGDDENVIRESEWSLETRDVYKKQVFTKVNNAQEDYDEYDYLCIPFEDKVGFRFVTREYLDDTLKEAFAFGKLDKSGKFKALNSVFIRKNSPYDAIILKSADEEGIDPEKVMMDYGKVCNVETQLCGLEYYEFQANDDNYITINANRLSKVLTDMERIEMQMLKDFKVVPRNFVGDLSTKTKKEIKEDLDRVKKLIRRK